MMSLEVLLLYLVGVDVESPPDVEQRFLVNHGVHLRPAVVFVGVDGEPLHGTGWLVIPQYQLPLGVGVVDGQVLRTSALRLFSKCDTHVGVFLEDQRVPHLDALGLRVPDAEPMRAMLQLLVLKHLIPAAFKYRAA